MLDTTLRMIVIDASLKLISNDGKTIETAIDVTKAFPEVEYAEVGNTDADAYIAPSTPMSANEDVDYGPFEYNIFVRDGVNLQDFVLRLQSNIEERLGAQGVNCAIMVET
jgi:hypothetical protein